MEMRIIPGFEGLYVLFNNWEIVLEFLMYAGKHPSLNSLLEGAVLLFKNMQTPPLMLCKGFSEILVRFNF